MRALFVSLAIASGCSFQRPADVNDDGGSGSIDAAAVDGSLFDAPLVDATPPDAMPPPPIVSNQPAYLVLGQPNMDQNAANNGGISGFTMYLPSDVWSDGTKLWVADDKNTRVLQWNAIPAFSHAPASLAIGEANFTDGGSGGSGVAEYKIAGSFGNYQRLGGFTVGNKVLIADPGYNRVMIWSPIPSSSGLNANQVLGYSDFMGNGVTTPTASNFHGCSHVWTDGTKVAVADAGNSRVLLWNNFPGTNGQAADTVLGASSFSAFGGGLGPDKMSTPMGVWYDGSHLFVADQGNNRVMVWNGWPTTKGKSADYFIGQTNGTIGDPNAGAATSDAGLSNPRGVIVAGGALFVADKGNNRVVMYYPIPSASGQKAKAVLGQPDFVTGTAGLGANKMSAPAGVGTGDGYLFVADQGNNRVLSFQLAVN